MSWKARFAIFFHGVFTLALLTGCSQSQESPAQTASSITPADLVFTNGKVYTVNDANPWAEAVAVRGEQIVFVGESAGADSYVGEGTQQIDLGGKMLMPGFVEGHTHPIAGAMIARGLDVQTDDRQELFTRIRDYAAANPDLEAVVGYGLRFNLWTDGLPTSAMLDEIESERPVFFFAIDGHAGWGNSKAFEVAGIDKDTPDPSPGYSFFERDEHGNPTGWAVETQAMVQLVSGVISLDREYALQGLQEWLPKLSAAGVTTAYDFGITGLPQEEGFALYIALEDAGKLPMRVLGVQYWNDASVDPILILKDLHERFDSELVSVNTLKVNLDGGDDKWNALYVDGYNDKPDVVVEPAIPYDVVNDAVMRADAEGFNVVCHCFGDLAVRKLLDAIEATIATNPERDRRFSISHATLVHPDDIGRFGELDVTYDSSGTWMSLDPLLQEVTTTRLGRERVDAMFPMKAVADAGGNVSLGLDWAVSGYISDHRPLMAIRTAVTRQLPGRDDVPPLGGEAARVPLDLAIRANTLGAAYGMGMDDKIGSIEVGKLADLVVLDQNLFEVAPHDIHTVNVLSTYMNGKLVHDSSERP